MQVLCACYFLVHVVQTLLKANSFKPCEGNTEHLLGPHLPQDIYIAMDLTFMQSFMIPHKGLFGEFLEGCVVAIDLDYSH